MHSQKKNVETYVDFPHILKTWYFPDRIQVEISTHNSMWLVLIVLMWFFGLKDRFPTNATNINFTVQVP